MPHLSPMFWSLAMIVFSINLILLTAALWWDQSPQFPKLAYNSPAPNKWSWS
uniref:ATP synthase F0 subunit 8 n=1 Tax=Paralvinella palmiformis TaxID=53620 RepID=UPI00208F0BB5|nr:ATP synthase F0 subunit 8 [Paralvinella palmiformis]UJI65663.1 ATP synthase F0 subunit 8 [Paralvinella palmiformis]